MDNQTNQTNTSNQQGQGSDQTCANCNMPKAEWRGNNGQGLEVGGKTYCCQGCATGTGCTCA